MSKVRIGVIGLGNMGSQHAQYLYNNAIEGAALGALCDIDPDKLKKISAKYPGMPAFPNHKDLLESNSCDAILVAVPHYDHVPIALDAFAKNIHVLLEKPLAVSVKAGRQCVEEYKKFPHLKFGIMLNQRNRVIYQKMRELIAAGEIGEVSRITWICTNWFRSFAY